MIYPKLPTRLLTAVAFTCLTLSSWGAAGQANAEIDAFLSTDFSPVSTGDVSFRFTELFGSSGANNSTHILIDGLVELDTGSGILVSTYAGIDIATGTEYDVGQVLLTLPSGAQTTGATSPIVGIVPRTTPTTGSSGWSQFVNTPPSSTTVGGSTGTVTFDPNAGTLDFNLSGFVGSANYSLSQDGSVASIEPFSLSDGSSVYGFEASELLVINNQAAGVIVSSDSSPGYDSLLFNLMIDSDLAEVSPNTPISLTYQINTPEFDWANILLWDWDSLSYVSAEWELNPQTVTYTGLESAFWYQPGVYVEGASEWLFRSYAQTGVLTNDAGLPGVESGVVARVTNPNDTTGVERAMFTYEMSPSNEWCNVSLWDWSLNAFVADVWVYGPSVIEFEGLESGVWYSAVVWGDTSNKYLFEAYAQSGIIDSTLP